MDQGKLIKAREYYDLVKIEGKPRGEAAIQVYGEKNTKLIEETPEYLAIVAAASQVEKAELRTEVEQLKRKQIKSFANLLDAGEKILASAETVDEKLAAQANQRENLRMDVVDRALDWDGENRNQNDLGDVLEGIVI